MAKEDVADIPARPPRKRYQIQNEQKIPDLWLATWAHDESLLDRERRFVQEERDRRKAQEPDRKVGVLVDAEDVTPAQLAFLEEKLAGATEIHHPWTTRRVAGVCRRAKLPVTVHRGLRGVVLASDVVICAPRAPEDFRSRTPAWEAINYARHRKLGVVVMLPDGQVAE